MSKTPMMRQYDEAKNACGDALLLFRMGDFYELFHEDARIAAKELGMTLTSRDKGANAVPMAGFPHHQLDGYLAKLIKRGFRVAVCEQVEDPKTAKGLVKREIAQLVSPGTVVDQTLLDPSETSFLVSIVPSSFFKSSKKKNRSQGSQAVTDVMTYGVAWAELSSGKFHVSGCQEAELADLLARLDAKEILYPEGCPLDREANPVLEAMCTARPDWSFALEHSTELLQQQLGLATLDGLGMDAFGPAAVSAAGGILEYVKETQRESLSHFDSIQPFFQQDHVEIDSATWRSLEVNRTIRTGDRHGSLFDVMDRSVTPMGSRQLGDWLANPLTDRGLIEQRYDLVETLLNDGVIRRELRTQLKEIHDMQRLLARVATARTSPRDLMSIAQTLTAIPTIRSLLDPMQGDLLRSLTAEMDDCKVLSDELMAALVESPPGQSRDGGFLTDGYDSQLDELRKLAAGGKQWIANYQKQIGEETGIPNLKVGFNKVFGYYVEVTQSQRDKIPETFIRKQTLKNAERYITPELKEYEEKVLSADSQALERELELFGHLKEMVQAHTHRLKTNAQILAQLDAFAALSQLAAEQKYCRPDLTDDQACEILEGRHPVLDIIRPLGEFVPNDTKMISGEGFLHLITGPNMAGKSTYIRQVALITLLAQIGSFVPARQARLGVVDRIFARVGASDELTRGQSTFMVEMTETARILNTATQNSLVILDEIGRGTSTYDGVSLAWAIVEYMHDQIGCRTLFATHYHELTELEQTLEGVRNFNVAVEEWNDQIVFIHKIVEGAADKSYGIQVAKLAGVPGWVNQRAAMILEKLEAQGDTEDNRNTLTESTLNTSSQSSNGEIQLTLFGPMSHPLVDKIKAMDTDNVTPMGALELLHQWQHELNDE